MKRIKQLITNKIIKLMPALFERKAALPEEQLNACLRVMEDKGIQRIYATQEEIDRMLAIDKTMEHDVEDCLKIIRISTYKRWLRKRRGGEPIQRPGRKAQLLRTL